MDSPEKKPKEQFIPIPKTFYSFATGEPFKECVCCNKYLLQEGTFYVIEKAVIQYPGTTATDVAFEYAMCLECVETMRKSLSAESLARITQYLSQNIDFEKRQLAFQEKEVTDIHDWISSCAIKNTPGAETAEYQIMACCNGNQLFTGYAPYMLCAEALEELSELISAKTKEVLDDFIDQYFGLPPELKELVKEKNLLLI